MRSTAKCWFPDSINAQHSEMLIPLNTTLPLIFIWTSSLPSAVYVSDLRDSSLHLKYIFVLTRCVEMLLNVLSSRIKIISGCSLAFTAARMYSAGPAATNPVVYFDIAADNQSLGRVTFEVSLTRNLIRELRSYTNVLSDCLRFSFWDNG